MKLDTLFDELHILLREGEYDQVVLLLLGSGKNINSPYDQDKNHAWYLLGDVYYLQEKYEDAVSAFKHSIGDRQDDVEAMLALANCYSEMELPDKAEKALREAMKYSPSDSSVIYNLANSLFDQGEYKKAIEIYEKIPSRDQEISELAQKNISHAKKLLKDK